MKKFALALLALATALAITPAAMADTATFNFSYYSNDGITGTFGIGAAQLSTGEWVATSGSGLFYGLGQGPLTPITPNVVLVANPTPPNQATSPTGFFFYDNVLLPGANPLLTNNGLLFDVTSGADAGLELNIFSNGTSPGANDAGTYQAYLSNGANDYGNFTLSSFTITPTPEPSSLLLLGTGLLGLAIVVFRKARPSGLVLHT